MDGDPGPSVSTSGGGGWLENLSAPTRVLSTEGGRSRSSWRVELPGVEVSYGCCGG